MLRCHQGKPICTIYEQMKTPPVTWPHKKLYLVFIIAIGCSGMESQKKDGEDLAGDSDASINETKTNDDDDLLVGLFEIRTIRYAESAGLASDIVADTLIKGTVYNGDITNTLIFVEDDSEADCRLLVPSPAFCDPSCGADSICMEDGHCKPLPIAQNVGSVTVKGLRTVSRIEEISINPTDNIYESREELLYPPFSGGDDITLEAEGVPFTTAFSLNTKGIAPLEDVFCDIESLKEHVIENRSGVGDEDLTIRWTPAIYDGVSHIHVDFEIGIHGGMKGKIECDTDDTGSITISANLLQKLASLDIPAMPMLLVSRRISTSTFISAGRIDLVVSSGFKIL